MANIVSDTILSLIPNSIKLNIMERGFLGGVDSAEYHKLKIADIYGIEIAGVIDGFALISPMAAIGEDGKTALENTFIRQLGIRMTDIESEKIGVVNVQLNHGNMVINGKAEIGVQVGGYDFNTGEILNEGINNLYTVKIKLANLNPVRAATTKEDAQNPNNAGLDIKSLHITSCMIYHTSIELSKIEAAGISLGEGDGGMEASPKTLAEFDKMPATATIGSWVDKRPKTDEIEPKGRVNDDDGVDGRNGV